jgi:hypothetical protein
MRSRLLLTFNDTLIALVFWGVKPLAMGATAFAKALLPAFGIG